jgi:hypothetical protein
MKNQLKTCAVPRQGFPRGTGRSDRGILLHDPQGVLRHRPERTARMKSSHYLLLISVFSLALMEPGFDCAQEMQF